MPPDDEARAIARGLTEDARNALTGRGNPNVTIHALSVSLRDLRTVRLIWDGEVTQEGARVRAALVEMEARDGE